MPTTAANYQRARDALRFVAQAPQGKHYFVNSVTGVSGGGYTADSPLTTLAAAIALCTAAKGDTIHVLPGHVESITGAAGIAGNVSGVTVLGYGNGRNRPVFTFDTAAAASFDISAANFTLQNMTFVAGIDAITAMFNVTAADVAFLDNEIVISDGTFGAIIGILTAATATRLRVERNRFTGPAINAGTTCTACIQHESGVDYLIRENYFVGKMTQAIKNVATVLRGAIISNFAVIGTGTSFATMAAASTPFVSNNRINVPSGTAPITAVAGFVAGNVYSAAAGVTAGTASTI
ncbi:MAG: hypothetical protein EXS05_22100 [Planctomycetaceae bacterium]|nr:hypothetical protein [Planctomycetaceae bacterium]